MNNPLDAFFKLGDKVTKGDPLRKAKFDYYLLWMMFFAFVLVASGNAINFYKTMQIHYLGWTFVILAILWFQYGGLKQARQVLKTFEQYSMQKKSTETLNPGIEPVGETKEDSVKEMMEGFKKK